MSRVFKRAEIWTELQCNSGVQKCGMMLESLVTTEKAEGLVVVPRLTATVPMNWSQRSEVVCGRVICVLFDDDSFDEYRIIAQSDSDGGDGLVHIEAAGPILDLANRNTVISSTTGGVTTYAYSKFDTLPSSLLATDVCGNGPSYFSAGVGTVTPTSLIDASFNGDSPLEGGVKVATEANRVTGVTYWLNAVRNGTSGYFLYLNVPAGGAGTPFLLSSKNIASLRRRQDSTQQTTRVVPIGTDGQHCGQSYWSISAVSLNTYIELTDIMGGPGPVQEANQFLNLYLEKAGGGTQQITATSVQSATTSRFNVAATAGFTAGDRIRIVLNSTPDDMPYVDCVANKATYGVKLGRLSLPFSSVFNRLLNADLRNGGTSPTSWTKTGGGTLVRDTTLGNYLYGGGAVKLTVSSIVLDQTVTVQVPASGNWYANYCCVFKGDPTAGAGTVQFGAFYAGGAIPNSPVDLNPYFDGKWYLLYQSYLMAAGSRTLQMSCSMGRVMWFNGGMIYVTQGSASEEPFFLGSGGARMIQAANAHLTTNSGPLVTYDMDLVDLYRVNPTIWSGDRLGLGATCSVLDSELGLGTTNLVQVRIVELTTDHLDPANAKVVLSNRREQLTSILAAA